MIPDDVIEAMATAAELTFRVGGNANAMMRAALPAAAAAGWNLVFYSRCECHNCTLERSRERLDRQLRGYRAAPSAKDVT